MDLTYFNTIPTDLFFLVSRELRLDQIFSLARNWPVFSQAIPDQLWDMRFRDQFHRNHPSSAKKFYEKAYKLFDDYMNGKGNVKDMDITSYNTLTSYAPTYIKKINDTSLGYAKGLSLMMDLGLAEEAEQFLLRQPDMFTSKYM